MEPLNASQMRKRNMTMRYLGERVSEADKLEAKKVAIEERIQKAKQKEIDKKNNKVVNIKLSEKEQM